MTICLCRELPGVGRHHLVLGDDGIRGLLTRSAAGQRRPTSLSTPTGLAATRQAIRRLPQRSCQPAVIRVATASPLRPTPAAALAMSSSAMSTSAAQRPPSAAWSSPPTAATSSGTRPLRSPFVLCSWPAHKLQAKSFTLSGKRIGSASQKLVINATGDERGRA